MDSKKDHPYDPSSQLSGSYSQSQYSDFSAFPDSGEEPVLAAPVEGKAPAHTPARKDEAYDDAMEAGLLDRSYSFEPPALSPSRNAFIRKVLIIVAVQLVVVAAESLALYGTPPVRDGIVSLPITLVAIVGMFVLLIALHFLKNNFPWNFVLLLAFTLATGFFVAVSVSITNLVVVIEAVVICAMTVVPLIAYTIFTRSDFHFLGSALACITWVILLWALFAFVLFPFGFFWLAPVPEWWIQLVTLFFIMLYILYLLYDVSNLVHRYNEDDYIPAAIAIYLDIINLFLCLMSLMRRN
mmetsp:Transcript_30594/g.76768  ORF Transcript_30594/g.76768 Transcript_30594/m.76768 type:complete len:297 (-) Transcript_30594:549-1439(-)